MSESKPLEGEWLTASGKFTGTLDHDTISDMAEQLGGHYQDRFSNTTTCVISTPRALIMGSRTIAAAHTRDIPIVNLQWLLDCKKQWKKLDMEDYLLWDLSPGAYRFPDGAAVAGKKRRRSPSPTELVDAMQSTSLNSQSVDKGRRTKPRSIYVSLDESCNLYDFQVFIDSTGAVYSSTMTLANVQENWNKLFRIQLLHNKDQSRWAVWTKSSRVGDPRGHGKGFEFEECIDAMMLFDLKFAAKTALTWVRRHARPVPGYFTYIAKDYAVNRVPPQAIVRAHPPPECSLTLPVQELMKLIFNEEAIEMAMSDLNYDFVRLPLTRLSKKTIRRGFGLLKQLADIIDQPNQTDLDDVCNQYYSAIPHACGRNKLPLLTDHRAIRREMELLENLSDMKDADLIMKLHNSLGVHRLDKLYNGLGLEEMTALDPASDEYRELKQYLDTARNTMHRLRCEVQEIFRIRRKGERIRKEQSVFGGPKKDSRLLFHGSATPNFGGILSQGLRIAPPEAPRNGFMFDKGIYLADMSTKSAKYCRTSPGNTTGLLLLCEAELGGNMLKLYARDIRASETVKANGAYSVQGVGLTDIPAWKDAGCVHPSLAGVIMPNTTQYPPVDRIIKTELYHNEYICYDVAQVQLRYLFRVTISQTN